MTEGIHSHGVKIGIGDGASPENFSNLTEGFAIPRFGGTKGTIDFSNHDSVAMREFKPQKLAEGEEFECQANYIPGDTNQALFKAAYDNETEDSYQIELSDGSKFTFTGICLGWHPDPSELDGRVTLSFSIKPVTDFQETNPS